jgi:hypothetical protein
MKKILLIVLILIGLGIGGYFYYVNFFKQKEVHYHAGFRVYVDGKQVDFTALKYMSVAPCTTEGAKLPEDDQEEKAHLHDFVGDVVHVERSNAVWGDLFKNIKYPVDTSKPIVAYINGRKVDNILHYPIRPYDSLILLIGKHGSPSDYLKNAVTRAHIVEVEKKSEACGVGS